jgi:hypothetical protein
MSSGREALSLVSGAFTRRVIGWLVVSPLSSAVLCSLLSGRISAGVAAAAAGFPWSLGLCCAAHVLLLLLTLTTAAAPGRPPLSGSRSRAAVLAILLLPPLSLVMSACATALLARNGVSHSSALFPTALAAAQVLAAAFWEKRELPATDMMQAVALPAQLLRASRIALVKAARATGVMALLIVVGSWLLPWRLGLSSFHDFYFVLLVVFLVNAVMHTAHNLLLVFLFQPLNWSKISRNTTASTDLLKKCLQLGFAWAIKAGEAAEQKELAAAGAVDVPHDMLNGFQAHAKHKPLAWELQVVRQSAIARKLLDGVRLPVLLPGPPLAQSGKDEEIAGTLPIGAPLVRAIAMMDLMRLARYSRERRQAIFDDSQTGKAIASAACTVMDNAVLRLQLLSVYIHQEVLGAKDVVLTSSAGVAPAGGGNNILPEVNLSGGLQWGAVEALKKAKSVQESTVYASIRRILGKQFGKLGSATYNWLLKATLPDSPFLPIERCELVWAIEGVTLLMQKAVNEDTKGTAQHLLPALLNSLVALQLALQDYGHAMYCANLKWKQVPPGCSAVTPNDVRAVGIAVDEGITRLLKTYGHVLRFYTFPAAYAGELKARLSVL